MTPDISGSLIADYGLLGLAMLAIGYMVRELLTERRRNEKRTDERHQEHIQDIIQMHDRHQARLEVTQHEYQNELRNISSDFTGSIDRLSGSVSALAVKVDVMVGEIGDLKHREEWPHHNEQAYY